MGLDKQVILQIYQSKSDWEFILKIDSLLEAAVKEVVKNNIVGSKLVAKEQLEDFLEALPLLGRTSLLTLLRATGCNDEDILLIESVRRLRNGFAHNIKLMSTNLIDVIKNRKDKFSLMQGLSSIADYTEADLIKMYEDDGGFLRYGIIDGVLRFLIVAYHVAVK
jgi:hypothetical protein